MILDEGGKLPAKLSRGARAAIARAAGSQDFQKLKAGDALKLAWPAGWEAESVMLVKLPRKASVAEARRAGATIGAALGSGEVLVMAGNHPQAADQLAFKRRQ